MTNSAGLDQKLEEADLDLHCLQRQNKSGLIKNKKKTNILYHKKIIWKIVTIAGYPTQIVLAEGLDFTPSQWRC